VEISGCADPTVGLPGVVCRIFTGAFITILEIAVDRSILAVMG
jgi:hypothetical protein